MKTLSDCGAGYAAAAFVKTQQTVHLEQVCFIAYKFCCRKNLDPKML